MSGQSVSVENKPIRQAMFHMFISASSAFVGTLAPRAVHPCSPLASFRSRWICPHAQGVSRRPSVSAGSPGRARICCFDSAGSGERGFLPGEDDNDEDDDLDDDFDPDNEFAEYETVVLTDPATDRSLPCIVENEVDVEGQNYLVCSPQEDVVAFAFEENEELVCVEGDDDVTALFETARAVMEEQHIKLKRSAFVMTADDTDYRILTGEEDDEEEEEDGEFGDDDVHEDDVEVIGEFCHDGNYFLVVRPETPILLVARRTKDGLLVPDDDELERITPAIEARLEELDE